MLAPRYQLDLAHVVTVGHSAGGHLAVWAAARTRIAKTSALYKSDPLSLHAAVSLSGILDLASYRGTGPDACGGPPTIDGLIGKHTNPYADTSPARLLPSGVHQVIFSGDRDRIVPAPFGHAYAKGAKAAGDRIDDIEIENAGHFEMIDPKSAAWPIIESTIVAASK